jgi:hypothetical protein
VNGAVTFRSISVNLVATAKKGPTGDVNNRSSAEKDVSCNKILIH